MNSGGAGDFSEGEERKARVNDRKRGIYLSISDLSIYVYLGSGSIF